MKIERVRVKGRVSLTQKAYLQKVVQKFLIGDEAKSVSSPLVAHFKLSARMSPKIIDEREYMSSFHMPVQLVALCILRCSRDLFCHRP